MDSQTTLVVTALPNKDEMDAVQSYLKGVLPLFMGAGGKMVKRLKVNEVTNGRPAGMVLVMEFDSTEAIKTMFDSEEYAGLIPARDRGFAEMNIYLTQDM